MRMGRRSSSPKVCRDMFLLFFFLMIFPSVLCDYRWSVCNNASTFREGSSYSTNLERVIADISRNAPKSSGFNTSSRGQSPNKTYGLLQCIGNVSAAKCSNCSVQARNITQEICANDIGARVWMGDCFMHYDNSNFISTLDTKFVLLTNTKDVTSNSQAFMSTTSSLLSNLSEKAYLPANKLLGSGSKSYSASDNVYGLVQCWRDLSVKDCRSCLFQAKQQLVQCCSSKQGAHAMSGSCTVRYEIYPFLDSQNVSSPSSPSPSPSPEASFPQPTSPPAALAPANPTAQGKSKKSSKTLPIVLGIVLGTVLAILVCLIAMRKRVKSAILEDEQILSPVTKVLRPILVSVSYFCLLFCFNLGFESVNFNSFSAATGRQAFSPQSGLLQQERSFIFSLEELAEATENFHDNNKLGEGGFGAVYKGITRDGKQIGVKKLAAKSRQGKEEFMNEIKLVANVQHRNLVKLFGCCVEGDERLIVYEFMPNKSLDTFLFDPEKRRVLDWEKRYNIIIGVARGLLYLHEDSQMKIIHRDIKANNILLDENLRPKIADFGLARLFDEEQTHVQTRVAGTYGYMAPEYAMQGQLSVKADVYSFGVLLLEIVSGRKNIDTHLDQGMENLLEWAWRLYKDGNIMRIVDSTVSETCVEEQALRCIHVGFLCVQTDPVVRPPISNVTMMMSSGSVTLPNPTKPAFISNSEKNVTKSGMEEEEVEKGTSGTTTSSASTGASVNEASVTAVQSR